MSNSSGCPDDPARQKPRRTLREDAEEQRKGATGGTSVGMDNVSAASENYKVPFKFTGRREKVTIDLK